MKQKIYLQAPSFDPSTLFKSTQECNDPFGDFLEEFSRLVASWGYDCVRPKEDIYGHPYHPFGEKFSHSSGTPLLRAKQLDEALRAENVAAIFAVNGGGMSKDVIVELKKIHHLNPFPKSNIPYIGLSDSTPVGLYLESIGAVTHVQGPSIMGLLNDERKFNSVLRLSNNQEAFKHFLNAIGEDEQLQFELTPVNEVAAKLKNPIKGIIQGGCNYNVVHACGTEHEPNWIGNILYLEGFMPRMFNKKSGKWEVSYAGPGSVKNAITDLQGASNVLNKVSAIIVGDIYAEHFPENLKKECIQELEVVAKDVCVPFFRGIPHGHNPQALKCYPIPMGTNSEITPGEKFILATKTRRNLSSDNHHALGMGYCNDLFSKESKQKNFEKIKPIILQDLVPINHEAFQGEIKAGTISGYSSIYQKEGLFYDSLNKTGVWENGSNIDYLMIPGEGCHSQITDMVLRGQLKGLKGLILKYVDANSKQASATWLEDYSKSHLIGVPTFTYVNQTKFPNRFTCLLERDRQVDEDIHDAFSVGASPIDMCWAESLSAQYSNDKTSLVNYPWY